MRDALLLNAKLKRNPMSLKPSILIVDDIRVNLFLIESLLKKMDINLIQATSGIEALEKAKNNNLALAILDVRMPGMNGYELASRLNADRQEDIVPVIFLTANYMNEKEIESGYNSGAVDYIIKPFNQQILLSKVNVFLEIFRQKQIIRNSKEELLRVNEALRFSEAKYRNYIKFAPDGVFITNQEGKFLELNEATSFITGYSEEELLSMSLADILPEKFLKTKRIFFNNSGQLNDSNESLFRHKSGKSLWMAMESVKLKEGQFLHFIKDITAKKRAEQNLHCSLQQLQQLTQHIEEVRENERVVIARELHDDLGQALTAVRIDLGILKQGVGDNDQKSKIDEISELVRETIYTVQRITSELRPQIIDDLGLEAAIEWYSNEFSQRNKLQIVRRVETGIQLSPSAALVIFRIMQESLTNVSRYAKASKVEIELKVNGKNLEFSVSDNGVGISETGINSRKSFGIIGMKERAASLGGTFQISGASERGTTVRISFPLSRVEKTSKANHTS